MRTRTNNVPASVLHALTTVALFLLLSACGSGGGGGEADGAGSGSSGGGGGLPTPPEVERDFDASFVRGPIPWAVRATVQLTQPEPIESVKFSVQTKPGNQASDIGVTYAKSYLTRESALDEPGGQIVFTVFGLYQDYDNNVTIEVRFPSAAPLTKSFVVNTLNDPPLEVGLIMGSDTVSPNLGMDFLLISRIGPPAIVDIDGETRWIAPEIGTLTIPCAVGPEGIVMGDAASPAIHNIDWLGQTSSTSMSDPRCLTSHHNIEPGKAGLLNTISFEDGVESRPESVLAEMSPTGTILKLWDFDKIFADFITSQGEDPTTFVQNSVDWFHMNSAVYDASDDSIISSSRENFIVKTDYATGDIKWIIGNPGKAWYTDFPQSLQTKALTVIGNAPIGQHSLSVSPDGKFVTCFNNGQGNVVLPDVGDTVGMSRVSTYEIDLVNGQAIEVLSLTCGTPKFSPFCSSAYRTDAGNMIVTFSTSANGDQPRIFVVNDLDEILFEGPIYGESCQSAYSAREFDLKDLLIE